MSRSIVSADMDDATTLSQGSKKHGLLPIGQPPGLLAFADAWSPGLTRYWREFSGDELYQSGHNSGSRARAFVTVDQHADEWHVCFMQEPDVKGVSVTNSIETLATCLYREARRSAGLDRVKYPNPLATVRHWWATRQLRAEFAHSRFHFYQHTCATQYFPEQFDRVLLRFKQGEFYDPKWIGFKVAPEIIQQGHHGCVQVRTDSVEIVSSLEGGAK